MPIDPSIPLSVKPPAIQVPNPLETLQAIAQIQGLREQTEARRLAGEERRQQAREEAAARQRAQAVEQRVAAALTLHPTTGRPTIDFTKLLAGGEVPPGAILALSKDADDAAIRLADLDLKDLTLGQKKAETFATLAVPVRTAGFAKPVWDAAVLAAFNRKAITAAERDAGYAMTDPAAIQRATEAAIAGGGGKQDLEKITTVDAEGREVTQFVQPTAGASYPVAPPKPPTPAFQQKDVLLDGKPAVITFDSHSGKSFLGDQDVTARVRPIPPQGPGPEPIVSIIGPDGKPIYVTRSQALGKTPGGAADAPGGIKLTAGQQDDLATMLTVQQLAADATTLGTKTGWAGVGPWQGRVGATMLGSGGTEGETLRNKIGNIKGTIAKLRGGTSFTPNEQALLESYTPTETDPDWKIQAKLASMVDFIEKKRANTLRVARGEYTLPAASVTATTTGAPKEGTEGVVGGVPAIWKTVNGKAGWYKK